MIFFKTTKGLAIVLVAGLIIGFVGGMEYKAYQVRRSLEKFQEGITNAFGQVSNDNAKNNTDTAATQQANLLSQEEKQAIMSQLEISVNVEEYKSILDSENRFNGKSRSLKGKIKNNGNQAVETAELLVKFLDANDKPIYENQYNPLYNSDKFDTVPLKPNYSNEFSFNTDGVPQEWSGKIEYHINDVSLEKSE